MERITHEKRTHPRVSVFRPLIYQSDIYPKIRVAVTSDLSPRGARIENTSYLYSQERLSLWFSFEPRVIHCRGRVVHVQRLGEKSYAGICFESMTAEDRMVLTQYLADLAGEETQP